MHKHTNTSRGHEGYVIENPRVWGEGGFRGTLKGPKNFGVSIWNNEIENVDFRPRTYTENFGVVHIHSKVVYTF